LYEKGLSVADIAEQTGIGSHKIWKTLKAGGVALRSTTPVPFSQWKKENGKQRARPPYGFCFFEGRVIKEPREYKTLLVIQNLGKQGVSISSIVDHLNCKGLKSRTGKCWSYNVIKATLGRLQDGSLDHFTSDKSKSYESTDDTGGDGF
jgi:hypothetical protein